MLKNLLKNKKGATVVLSTLLILSAFLVVILMISDLVNNGLIMSRKQVHSTQAYYAAEAGAERMLWVDRVFLYLNDSLGTDPQNPGDGPISLQALCSNNVSGYWSCIQFSSDNLEYQNNPEYSTLNSDSCKQSCSYSEHFSGFKQDLSNKTFYEIKYRYLQPTSGTIGTSTVLSYGNYNSELGRAVEVKYKEEDLTP